MALDWIPLPAYLELTKETEETVHKRVRAGHWLRDVHVRQPAGSRHLWVNTTAVNDWACGKKPAHQHGNGK